MIDDTKKAVEANYEGCKVIYGDTDSVMIVLPRGMEDKDRFDLCKRIGEELTETLYKAPNVLEFEKLYSSYILYGKKFYSGIYQEYYNGPKHREDKGIKSVKRDTSPLAKDILNELLDILHNEQNTIRVIKRAKEYVLDVLNGRLSETKFIMSKKLGAAYKNPNIPHAYLSNVVNKRSGMDVYTPGDRVPYIFAKNPLFGKGTQQYLRVEDPKYAKDNKISIDYRYYIEKQLTQTIIDCCIFIKSDLKGFFKDISIGGDGKSTQSTLDSFFGLQK